MFIKNDSSPEKRYYNGKIGIITDISRENVTVQCANEIDEIVTEKEQWDTVNYSINEETKELKARIAELERKHKEEFNYAEKLLKERDR